jgi:uncharacterized protein YdeI (YjbR/CyaY-like superfamily)
MNIIVSRRLFNNHSAFNSFIRLVKRSQRIRAVYTITMPKRVKSAKVSAKDAIGPGSDSSVASIPIQLFESAGAWESWLEANQENTTGLWMKISKKGSGIASVSYLEAIDGALCFGWIDGQRKSHDESYFLQRFTPRRKKSIWSQRNVDKVAVLLEAGRIRPSGQAEIDAAKADGRWDRAYAPSSTIQVPQDFQKALNGNKEALKFFDAINKSQRYSFLWRIETARRPETRQRRIGQFVEMLGDHKTL